MATSVGPAPRIPEATVRFLLERLYPTSVGRLWSLWTTREGIQGWWAPEEFRTEVRRFELRPGGPIEIVLRYRPATAAPGRAAEFEAAGIPTFIVQEGQFTDIVPRAVLAFTLRVDYGPNGEPALAHTQVTFRSVGDSVRLELRCDGPSTPHWRTLAETNLRGQLDRLGRAIGDRPPTAGER